MTAGTVPGPLGASRRSFSAFFQVVLLLALGHFLSGSLREHSVGLPSSWPLGSPLCALPSHCRSLSLPGPSALSPTALGRPRSLPDSPSCLQPHPSDNKVGRHGAHLDCCPLTASFCPVPKKPVFKIVFCPSFFFVSNRRVNPIPLFRLVRSRNGWSFLEMELYFVFSKIPVQRLIVCFVAVPQPESK